MCDMELKVNGEPITNAEFVEELRQAAVRAMREKLVSEISIVLTPDELSQLNSPDLHSTIYNLRFEASSKSTEIVDKIRRRLEQLGITKKLP